MITVPVAFLLSLLIALAMTPVAVVIARRVGAIDVGGKESRKIHTHDIPRLGGLAIVLAFYAPLIGLLYVDSEVGRIFRDDVSRMLGLLLGGVVVTGLGVFDDIVGANAKQKLTVQASVALALYALGFQIHAISSPFGPHIELGVLALPITLLWIVGVINALNLIDGLDGLASGVAFFAAATTLVVAYAGNQILMMLFMAALSGAVLGFLVYNFNPARIFMGDTGSMFLGYVLAVTSVQTNTKSQATVALLAPVLALGLPIMDTFLAMLRRIARREKMFSADRDHIHHRLLARGLTHRRAVLVLYGFSLLLAATALTVSLGQEREAVIALVVSGIVTIVLIRFLWHPDHTSQTAEDHSLLRALIGEISHAESMLVAWEASVKVAEHLSISSMRLQTKEGLSLYLWKSPESPPKVPQILIERHLLHNATVVAKLFMDCEGKNQLPRDERWISLLVAAITTTVQRVGLDEKQNLIIVRVGHKA